MKNKKVLLWLGSGILAVMIIIGAVFFAGGRNKTIKPEELKRATTARELLMKSFGKYPFAEDAPDYLVGRYIDEDCKLQIRLHESAKDQEAIIKEALGEYADAAVFSYVPVTFKNLKSRALEIEKILKQQGYSVESVWAESRTGNIRIAVKGKNEFQSVATWIKEQTEYPFDDVGIEYVLDNSAEKQSISQEAAEVLEDYLQKQEGYQEYYCGNYIDLDGCLHVILLENVSKSQRDGIESCLKAYSSTVAYEYGGYPAEEIDQYAKDLMKALEEVGLYFSSCGVDDRIGLLHISFVSEDIPLAQALLEKGNPYPFGNKKYTVVFELGGAIYIPY